MKSIGSWLSASPPASHPARGAWIEIDEANEAKSPMQSHPARGAWIEIAVTHIGYVYDGSHPARGAWIEITQPILTWTGSESHPARGAWIEMFNGYLYIHIPYGRTPQGVRGLKYYGNVGSDGGERVAPRKGCVD